MGKIRGSREIWKMGGGPLRAQWRRTPSSLERGVAAVWPRPQDPAFKAPCVGGGLRAGEGRMEYRGRGLPRSRLGRGGAGPGARPWAESPSGGRRGPGAAAAAALAGAAWTGAPSCG